MTMRRGSVVKSRIGMGDAIDGVFVDGANVVFHWEIMGTMGGGSATVHNESDRSVT
jgi:hypothetical protein